MNIAARREHVLRLLRRRNRYQFGQPDDSLVSDGAVACTDTCIQLIVWMAKDKRVSLDNVRRRSGAPAGQPMEADEAIRALRSYGLPYEIRRGLLASDVVRIAKTKGPVIVAERYWSHPQWLGYTYGGRTLKGWTVNDAGARVKVGTSIPRRKSGLTQWTFRDGHAVLVATDIYEDGKHYAVIRDPNHNSDSRPERPAYDAVTLFQLNRQLRSWPRGSLVLAPVRTVIK